LITGETGTGKDIISKILHQLSGRTGPYVAVNAAGLDDQLFSDALFGHVKGAFTGAQTDRPGLLGKAEHGTLFLDEIGDLSESSQVKLLRVLQEREYMPLGADQPKRTTARFVAATSVDLEEKMREGTFRKDLFFRLRAHPLEVPPLRKRKGDVKKFFDHFLEKCLNESNKSLSSPPVPEVYRLLEKYEFPGNIREIEALVYDVVFRMKDGLIHPAQVAEGLRFGENPSAIEDSSQSFIPLAIIKC
jgi:transcriptional regulator with PAS, ATPase and Fis domain